MTEFWHNNHTLSDYFSMRRQEHYSNDEIDRAIDKYYDGTKLKIFCERFPHIPIRTITRGGFRKRQNIAIKCPGPDPGLSFEMKSDLVDWVIGMQSQGYTVTRHMIFLKENEIYRGFYGTTQSSGYIKRRWLSRFMKRYPLLKTQTSQAVKCGRLEATEELLKIFIWELIKYVTEQKWRTIIFSTWTKQGFLRRTI